MMRIFKPLRPSNSPSVLLIFSSYVKFIVCSYKNPVHTFWIDINTLRYRSSFYIGLALRSKCFYLFLLDQTLFYVLYACYCVFNPFIAIRFSVLLASWMIGYLFYLHNSIKFIYYFCFFLHLLSSKQKTLSSVYLLRDFFFNVVNVKWTLLY